MKPRQVDEFMANAKSCEVAMPMEDRVVIATCQCYGLHQAVGMLSG